MTPVEILAKATADGLRIVAIGCDTLSVRGPAEARDRWVPILKARKLEIIVTWWAEYLREHFEERAAIHEFEGGLPRPEAEALARRSTAMVALAAGAPWAALRQALDDPALPNTLSPVDRLPYPIPNWDRIQRRTA